MAQLPIFRWCLLIRRADYPFICPFVVERINCNCSSSDVDRRIFGRPLLVLVVFRAFLRGIRVRCFAAFGHIPLFNDLGGPT